MDLLFSLKGKQRGRPSNTWFSIDCQEAWQNYHIVLHSSHLVNTPQTTFKDYHMLIWHKKHSYLKHKQKDPKLFQRSFKEKDDSTLPFTPQEAIDYCTKLYTLGQSINIHFIPNAQLPDDFTKGTYGPL